MKQTPILEVNRQYFDILAPIFSRPFAEMKRHGLNLQTAADDNMTSTSGAFVIDSPDARFFPLPAKYTF
jgi:hypothetical protein